MDRPTIVFFGSGPVALKSLQLLADSVELEAIITKPSTAQIMRDVFENTPVYVVQNRHELNARISGTHFRSRLGILIDFGIIISQQVIDAFPLGIINSHFSLLPELRGADPITFSILSGQTQTGVSLMLLTAGMDEGPLLAQRAYKIPHDATTAVLTDALIQLSDDLLKTIVPKYVDGTAVPTSQDQAARLTKLKPSYSRKLTKEDGHINWQKPATQIEREIRAYVIWPKSYTEIAGKDVVITKAIVSDSTGMPGEAYTQDNRLFVYCGQGSLEILGIKPAGKTEMSAEAFLAGYRKQL